MYDHIYLLFLILLAKIRQNILFIIYSFLLFSAVFIVTHLLKSIIQMPMTTIRQTTVRTSEAIVSEESCHLMTENDILKMIDRNTTFPDNSIFFHETSCMGGLNFCQACAVEAAARSHPQYQIYVLFTASVTQDKFQNSCLANLIQEFENINIARIYIPDYVDKTLLLEVLHAVMEDVDSLNLHVEKITKYLTMAKYSGIFLDLDVIVAKSFDKLWKNWAIRDSPNTLSPAMLKFSENVIGRNLGLMALRMLHGDVLLNKGHEYWSFHGPNVITKVLQSWCTIKKVRIMSLVDCNDVAVYGPDLFYNISFHDRIDYFKPITHKGWENWKSKGMYTFHVWQRFTKYYIISKHSLFSKIAAEFCPTIYKKLSNPSSFHTQFNSLC